MLYEFNDIWYLNLHPNLKTSSYCFCKKNFCSILPFLSFLSFFFFLITSSGTPIIYICVLSMLSHGSCKLSFLLFILSLAVSRRLISSFCLQSHRFFLLFDQYAVDDLYCSFHFIHCFFSSRISTLFFK